MRNRNHFIKKHSEEISAYAFALPFLILFTIFTVIPVVISVFLSFTDFNMLQTPQFVFTSNYTTLILDDDIFIKALSNTLLFAVIIGPGGYLLCFFFAWCLNELNAKIRSLFLLCLYAPSISGNAYLIWTLIFNGDSYGYLNGLLLNLGIIYEPIRFFNNTQYMVPLVIVVLLWMSLGTSLLVFVAGFQGIDRSLYEAAAVDGMKNRWQELWFITLPAMKPQLLFSAVMSITSAFGIGDAITGLTGNPSTKYAAHTLMHHLQDYGNTRFEMGYACAIATILFILMVGTNKIIQKLLANVGE
jgi:ABC transporter, permease protein